MPIKPRATPPDFIPEDEAPDFIPEGSEPPTPTPTPTTPPWLTAEVAAKKIGKTTLDAPPSMAGFFGKHLKDTAGEMASGAGELAGDILKGGYTAVTEHSPLADIYNMRVPGSGAVALAKGAAQAFGENAKDRFRNVKDQYTYLKEKGFTLPGMIARPETLLLEPEGREMIAQAAHTVVPEVETEEAIPGSGGALVPTGKALGKLGLETLMAAPPTKTLSALGGGGGKALKQLAASTTDVAAKAVSRMSPTVTEAAPAVAAAKQGSPLPKLDFAAVPGGTGPAKPMTIAKEGKLVGEAENLAFRTKKSHFSKIYKQMDEWGTIDARAIIDDAGNLRIPSDVALPEHIASAVKTIQSELKRLPKGGGEVATSPKLEAAFRQLQETPFSAAHELRHELGVAGRRIDPRGVDPSKAVPYWQAQDGVDNLMQQAADLVPGAKQFYDETTALYKQDVALPHYRGAGRDISKLMEGDAPTPELMGQVVPPFGADTVESAYRALVPDASRYGTAANVSGQKAFDHLVDQSIRTRLGAKNASDAIDLTTAADAIDTQIGDAAFQAMLERSSPQMQQYMMNLKRAAEAYRKIGVAGQPPHPATATGAAIVGGTAGSTLGGIGTAGGAYAGWRVAQTIPKLKADVLRWALAHPARTEILTQGVTRATTPMQLNETAIRNISNITRLYQMDTSRPPDLPKASGL